MSTNYNTCFIDSNGRDVAEEFVEKSYLLDVYPSLIDQAKAPSLWTWGISTSGRLGNGDVTAGRKSSPVQTISGGTNWKQVSVGSSNSLAIKSDGTLWTWGTNSYGQLGDNSVNARSSPVQTVSGGTNWKQGAAGFGFAAAIKTDGTLWLWGDGTGGQLGSASVYRSSPVQTVSAGTNWKQVSVPQAGSSGVAIKTDGTLWGWGNNRRGQLGTNSIIDSTGIGISSPVQTISTGTNWKTVAAGDAHTVAIKNDGTLWVWGRNGFGQLGNNNALNASSPVQTVSAGTNWKCVAASINNTSAIKTDGTLWLWGDNTSGQLGNNTVIHRSSPVQTISGGTNWKSVAMGDCDTFSIKSDGTLWTWGFNDSGRLGDNNIIDKSSPVQTVSGGTNWKQAATGDFSAAIREEGDW